MDLALLQVMRDGLQRRAEAAALTWGDRELQEDGSGWVRVARSKTDQTGRGNDLLAIRPVEAGKDPAQPVFGLSASRIGPCVRRPLPRVLERDSAATP